MTVQREPDLISRIRRRDPDAFRELYGRYYQRLYGLAYSQLRDRHQSEEALQEVFRSFLRTVFSGEKIEKPLHYLAHGVRMKALQLRSRGKKHDTLDGKEYLQSPSVKPVEHLLEGEEAARVKAALERIPEDQREVVVLHLYSGLTFREIHETLDIPLSTALRRYYSALEKLKNLLGEEL